VKYAWIAKNKAAWPVTLTCDVLGVSTSGYFEHQRRRRTSQPSQPGGGRLSNEALLSHIRAIHAEVKGEYGWPRIWKELLARDFTPAAPDRVWSSDITYIATDEGWLYLAAVIDLFSRQVVGWSMQPHMQASLVTDALRMAWFRRHPAPGLIFHSDRGSQYCSHSFQDALASYGMLPSMSRKGNCWDNAPTESLWGSLKVGRLYGKKFATQREAMDEVIDWLTFYNHRRLHSTLGYVSPMRFEANLHTGQSKKAA
jgi:putative transposase